MMTADPLESREELEAMSESIYWRNRRFGTVEQASDHREGVVEWFDANVRWQRVHVLTDDELAAKKAEWQAEAWERGLIQGRAASIDGIDLDLLTNPYEKGSDRIKKEGNQ